MPNIKSQEKRDRQGIKRALKNKVLKTRIKSNKKKLAIAVEGKDFDAAKADVSLYFKSLDKAAKKSAVSKNFVANKKSKAAKLVNSLKQEK